MTKRTILAALALTISLRPLAQAGNPEHFEKANQAYTAGSYDEAKKLYLSLVDAGTYSANLFYNLGDTFVRLDQPGKAMLNYERALALNPAHPEATSDLLLMRQRLNPRIAASSWVERLYPSVRLDLFAGVAAIAGWTIAFCIVALIYRAGRRRPLMATIVIGVLVLLYSAPAIWLAASRTSLAIVTAGQTTARFAPAETAAAAETLPAGSHVHILAERGGWTYGMLPDARRVWIASQDLGRVQPSQS